MKRYGYTHAVSGEDWIAFYLGHQDRIDALKNMCKEAYYAQVPGPTTEPTVELLFDEQWGHVRVFVEGFSAE